MKRLKRDTLATPDIQQDSSPDVESSKPRYGDGVFEQFFEAHFEPLLDCSPAIHLQQGESSGSGNEADTATTGSDWDGLSDDESHLTVQMVDYTDPLVSTDEPLNSRYRSNSSKTEIDVLDENKPVDKIEALNLKNDLALQRLLKESHLLDRSVGQIPQGSKRHQATDLRLQTLGSKESIFSQDKMPMAHRKGMQAKAAAREAARREEASVNGVILEREKPKKSRFQARRERGVGAPGVGRFLGGTLVLSDRDVRRIQGGRRTSSGQKRARR